MNKKERDKYEFYARDCLHGSSASCISACPFNLDIRALVNKIKNKSFAGAYRLYRDHVVFPEVVSKICPAPCMAACVLKEKAILMPALEKACVALMQNKMPNRYNMPRKPQKIAIIGAGLSGLACALILASKNYDVTVYEKSIRIGGHLWELMPQGEFIGDIEIQFQFAPYALQTGREIKSLEAVSDDALYIATGMGGQDFGLRARMHEPSLSSVRPGIFLGGRLIGASDMEAIKQGTIAAASIEKYLQIGQMRGIAETFHQSKCELLPAASVQNVDFPVKPASGSVYSKDDAIAEASRCLLCDCTACRDNCDLLQTYGQFPKKIIGDSIVSLFPIAGLEGPRITTRLIASCFQCGKCAEACPKEIDMALFFRDFRRMIADDKTFPLAFHDYFVRDMEFSNSDDYKIVRKAPDGKISGYAFFPGCMLGGANQDYVRRTYGYLLEKLPGTALMLECCGVPAEWAGEKGMLDSALTETQRMWEKIGKPVLIFACLTCQKTFKRFLPQIQGVSLYEIIGDTGVPQGSVPVSKISAAVFDPCASREFPAAQESVRRIAKEAGYLLEEMASSGKNALCCSYGGHTHLANPKLVDKVTQKRVTQSELPYITYCANCHDTFAAAGKEVLHILDVVFGLKSGQTILNRSAHRLNRRRLKPILLKEFWGEDRIWPEDPGGFLRMSEELKNKLSQAFILEEDVLRTIHEGKKTGRVVKDATTQFLYSHAQIGVRTYWVAYAVQNDGTYLLNNAYSHRLEIEE